MKRSGRKAEPKVVYQRNYEPPNGRWRVDTWNETYETWWPDQRYESFDEAKERVDWLSSHKTIPSARVVDEGAE